MTVLLFDLLGGSHILLAVLRALHHGPGTVIHVLAEYPAQPVRFSRHAASYTSVQSPTSPERIVSQIESLVRARHIDVVLPSGVAAARFLSTHGHAVRKLCAVAPLAPLGTMELAHNKGLLARHMQNHGIPHPRTTVVTSVEEALVFFRSLDGPALLKPLLGAGGRGIIRIDHPEELEASLQEIPPGSHLLQELIPGYDIDCSFLSDAGTLLAHTVQRGILPGISRYAAPGGAEYLHHQGVVQTASSLASSLGWSGVAHVDMRLDERDGQAKVLEVNPRFWRSILGSVRAGVNFPLLACRHALGERFDAPSVAPSHYIHESRVALRQIARQWGRQRPYAFSETVLTEFVRDPLPELALVLLNRRIPETRGW